MMIHHGLLPEKPPAPRCRRCGRPMKINQVVVAPLQLVKGLWCWTCMKFNPEPKP